MKKEHTFSLEGISVFIGMPARENIPPPTVRSLLNTVTWLEQSDVPSYTSIVGGGTICSARCQIAKSFLESKCNRLVFIDSDMEWSTEDFIRLLALSSKLDMVAGAYQGRFDPPHFYMRGLDGEDTPETVERNQYGCFKVAGIGMGFTAISRPVIEKLEKLAPIISYREDDVLPEIFRFGKDSEGRFSGEDMNFFEDARKLGYDLWVEPRIVLGHIGTRVYKTSIFLEKREGSPDVSDASPQGRSPLRVHEQVVSEDRRHGCLERDHSLDGP